MEWVSQKISQLINFMCTLGLGKCPSGQFECLNSSCINASSQCDGVADCSDGFDEIFCTTGCRLAEYRYHTSMSML